VNSAEGAGRTVEEAIRNALRALGAKRDDVDLMVLDEGSRGVLGLGSREARVRVTLLSAIEAGEAEDLVAVPADAGPAARAKDAPATMKSPPAEPRPATTKSTAAGESPEPVSADDPAGVARRITASVVDAMGIGASVTAREDVDGVQVTLTGPQLAPLIGRHGQTLEALDLLVNLMTTRQLGRRVQVSVDAERYRERRRETLEALARRVVGRVRRSGEPTPLAPMPASERRFIHTMLADDAQVTTYSEGEGSDRHIVIAPRGRDGGSRSSSRPGEARGRQAEAGAEAEESPEDTEA
jgi:spoIIIJ-associated protein